VQTVEALFSDLGKIDDTKRFYVCTEICQCNRIVCLERFMDNRPQKEKKAMLSFGLDFPAQRVLLQF
jgi:hypothetical protein